MSEYKFRVNLCTPPIITVLIKVRRSRWVKYVARIGKKRNAYRVLVGKHKEKKRRGTSRRRWEDNIKMYIKKWGGIS
jgi:hypothetical protein